MQNVWRQTLALSMGAFLVRWAIRVSTASNSNGRTSLTWVSSVPWRTEALVASQEIPAFRISSTWGPLADFFAFVDVSTKPSRFEGKSLRADAETVVAASENTLLVFWTRVGR